MSRAPRDLDELRELAGNDPAGFAATLEADGRAEGDPTKGEEARIVRRNAAAWTAKPEAAKKAASAKKSASGSKAARKPAKRRTASRTSATRRAVRDAVLPDRQVAGGIRRASSAAWSLAFGAILLVLVFLLVTKGPRSIAAIREIESFAIRVVYPPKAFPERHAGVQ